MSGLLIIRARKLLTERIGWKPNPRMTEHREGFPKGSRCLGVLFGSLTQV